MTKKDAAFEALGLAQAIHNVLDGDEGADIWIVRLLWLAAALYPGIIGHRVYREIVLGGGDTREAKLRRLIDHPETPAPERRAALAALGRVRRRAEARG